MWEALASRRGVVFRGFIIPEIEWISSRHIFPLGVHRFLRLPVFFVNKDNKNIFYQYKKDKNGP